MSSLTYITNTPIGTIWIKNGCCGWSGYAWYTWYQRNKPDPDYVATLGFKPLREPPVAILIGF